MRSLGVAARFIASISLLLLALFAVTAAVSLNLQSSAMRSVAEASRRSVDELSGKQIRAAGEDVRAKAQQTAKLLANIAPEPIVSFNLSTLLDIARVASGDPDIASVDFLGKNGRSLAKAGDKARGSDGAVVEAPIVHQGAELGKVVLHYSLAGVTKRQGEMRAEMEARLLEMGQTEAAALDASKRGLLWLMLSALAVGVAVCTLVGRSVSRPLNAVIDFAGKVALGDLGARAKGRFSGELAALKAAIENMVAALREKIVEANALSERSAEESRRAAEAMLKAREAQAGMEAAKCRGMFDAADKIEGVSSVLEVASGELDGLIGSVESNVAVQARRVTETASAVHEMNSTVAHVAGVAGETAEQAKVARGRAVAGQEVMNKAVSAIGNVEGLAEGLSQGMKSLGGRADSIGSIIEVISDIADQTNLLALNAAIEAARAGEAGRGFAVVADEVRKLAEKTMRATHEVGEAVADIQRGTSDNVERVNEVFKAVGSATGLARQAGESLDEIVGLVERTAGQIGVIARDSAEESTSMDRINHVLEEVHRAAEGIAEDMRRSRKMVEDLRAQTHRLNGVVHELQGSGSPEAAMPR